MSNKNTPKELDTRRQENFDRSVRGRTRGSKFSDNKVYGSFGAFFNPIGTWTLFTRESKRFMKVYMQTILGPVVNNLLYFAVFGLSMSRAIPEIHGVGYLEFLVPGLIIMGIVNNAYQNPSSSIMIMKYQGVIGDLMVIPLKAWEILSAFIGSAVFRAFIVGAATLATALFFVDLPFTSIPVILSSSLLISLFFSFMGFIVGLWASEFDKQAFILNFVLMPLTFLGGVFFPISSLSPTLQTISQFNPIVHMANLMRYGFTGLLEVPLYISFLVVAVPTLIIGIASYMLLRHGWHLQT